MRPRFPTATIRLAALACFALACDDSPTTVPPPGTGSSQWSEWRNLPPSFTTYALWASSASNVFAVGPAGTAARWNGTRWSPIQVAVFRDVWAVAGVPGGNVVAVGDGGTTLRFDGVAFVQTPKVTADDLRSVWIASPDTMLAVGEGGALLLGDGSTWSLQSQPTPRTLLSIWGTSPRDIFAVGVAGGIYHFDGADWSPQASGTTEILACVSGSASNDVYAVGTLGTILHYDGADWSPMTSPSRDVLQCVVAGAGEPLAVGANGVALQLHTGSWSPIDLKTRNWLYGICRNGANTWVGGSRVLRSHDGTQWVSDAPGAVSVLRDVCTDADGSAVVVGDDGYIARGRNQEWIADEGVDATTLYCAFRTRSGDLFVGGTNRLLHFNGTTWDVEASDFPTWHGLAESPAHVYAFGSNGTMRRRSGTSWIDVAMPRFSESINAMAWVAADEAYAVGDVGLVMQSNGVGWVVVPSHLSAHIYDVIENPGNADQRAFAVGASGGLYVLNEQGISALESPTSANLYALARAPNGDILAVGGGGAMLRYHGATWKVEDSPGLQPLYGAFADGDEIFAVGGGVAGGLVLRFGPP